MAKRIVYHITFDRKAFNAHATDPGLWILKKAGDPVIVLTSPYKKMLIKDGRLAARYQWDNDRQPSQLVVHGKDGKINFEATYGHDPRKYKS